MKVFIVVTSHMSMNAFRSLSNVIKDCVHVLPGNLMKRLQDMPPAVHHVIVPPSVCCICGSQRTKINIILKECDPPMSAHNSSLAGSKSGLCLFVPVGGALPVWALLHVYLAKPTRLHEGGVEVQCPSG